MALPAGYVLVEPQKTKLPEGYTLVSQKGTDEEGLPSIAKRAPREEPREAPVYDPLGQVIGDIPAPLDYKVEGQGRMNEPGAFTTIADLAKQFIAPGAKAPFALPLATETAAKGVVRQALEQPESSMTSAVQPGLVRLLSPLLMQQRDNLFGPKTEEDRLKKQLEVQRTIASIPSIPGAKALNKIGENVQKDILGSLSPEAKKALEQSQITGNIFEGEVDFGTNPNAYGYALQAANVFGSMAPVIATAMVTKSPGAGGFVGGTMAADEAATKAAEYINKIPDAELRQKSPIYAQLIAGGASPKEARELTVKKAAESGAALQGLVATFGDVFTGKLVTGAFDKAISKLGTNRAVRATGVGAASSLEEAVQETGEGLASDVTLKNVIPSKELGEDSAANFILGALGGAGPGVVKGALSEGEAKEPKREKYVKPEGGLAELIARQKGFLTPEGRPPAPPAAAQAPMPPAPPAGPAEAIQAPGSEAMDTQAMLEELINSVNISAPKEPEAEKPAETVFTAPSDFAYSITQSPAYGGADPLSAEDAEFELDTLLESAKRGRLTPQRFAESEIGRRLDTSQIMAINDGIRNNPIATIEALIQKVAPATEVKAAPAEEVKPQTKDVTLYHGTNTEYDEIDPSKSGGMAFFGEEESVGARYAQNGGGGRARLDDSQKYIVNSNGVVYELEGDSWKAVGIAPEEGLINKSTIQPLDKAYPSLSGREAEKMTNPDSGSAGVVPKSSRIIKKDFSGLNLLNISTPEGRDVIAGLKPKTQTGIALVEAAQFDARDKRDRNSTTQLNSNFWGITKYAAAKGQQLRADIVDPLKAMGYDGIQFQDDQHKSVGLFDTGLKKEKQQKKKIQSTTAVETREEYPALSKTEVEELGLAPKPKVQKPAEPKIDYLNHPDNVGSDASSKREFDNKGKLQVAPQNIADGGTPFKSRAAADAARKNYPDMRVLPTADKKGFILAPKTPKQIAADEAKAKRLRFPMTSPKGVPMAAHQFITSEGGITKDAMKDLGMDKNVRSGNRSLFTDTGMSVEQAYMKLQEAGYLDEGATQNDARNLITESVKKPKYRQQDIEEMAKREEQADYEDYLKAEEEASLYSPVDEEMGYEMGDFEGTGYEGASPEIQAEVRALLAQADALGINTDSIKEEIFYETENQSIQAYYKAFKSALEDAITTSRQNRIEDTGQPGGEGAEFKLTSATPDEIRAKLYETEGRAKEEERAKKAAEDKARADEQAAEFTLTGSDRAADVAAARGQRDIFAEAPAEEAPKPQTEQERTVSIPKKEFREDKETRGKSDHPALKMVFKGETPKSLIAKYGEKNVRFLGRLFDIDVKDKFNVAKKLIAIDSGLSLVRGKDKAYFDKMNKAQLGEFLAAVGQSAYGQKYQLVERLLKHEGNVMGKFNDNLQDLKHKAAVLNEARAGKPISEEVLKDYPDVAAFTLPRDSEGYKAAIRTLAVRALPTLGMDTLATIASYREDAKTTKDPLEKNVANDIADYMESYYKSQQEKSNQTMAKLGSGTGPTMGEMIAENKRVKAELAALEKGEAAPVDNKKEISDLRKEQKALMMQIVKAGMEETPVQEARMAEIENRINELEGKPAKPEVKKLTLEEIRDQITDLEEQYDNEEDGDKLKSIASKIYKLQGQLQTAEGAAEKLNKLNDPAEFEKALEGFEDAYGDPKQARRELKYYKTAVDGLIKKGGSIYRVLFVESENDIDENNLGTYWTVHSSNIDKYVDNLADNADEGTQPYVIQAKVPPNSVSNQGVDIRGNPDEEEVNIVANKDDITYTVHEYSNKQVGPAIRELGKEEPAEEPEAPKGTVATPDGYVLRYPLAVSMVGEGYKVLALDDPRTYKDKGGEPHRTFEKGPLRIAMTHRRVLFQNRNAVIFAFGNSNDLTIEAIMVDPGNRNQGLATQAMNDVIEAADKNEITLYLEPAPIVNIKKNDFGLDRDQLVDFYSKFGFEFQEDSSKVMERKPSAEAEVLPAEEPQIAGQVGFEPYTIEGDFTEVAEEQQRLMLEDQTENLSDDQVSTLEKHYGATIDSDEFFTKLREDVTNFIVKGATAVNGKIRAIIRQLANGVLAVGIAFNPQYMSQPLNVMMPVDNVRTEEVLAMVPDAATDKMSEPAKRAFAVIYPALQEQMVAKDKLFIMADKPSGRVFVFNPDGSLLLEKKSLFGLAKGDLYVGDNDKPQNRITPAGLFDLKLVDAQKGAAEKRTAGDYDTGTVLAINDPDGTITIMHSVWLKEKDAAQRAAALRNESPADSRYSFGCINVDAPTYSFLVNNHAKQMDGAALFIVPEAGVDVMSFITGKGAMSEDLARIKIKPVTKEVRTPQRQATQTEAKTKTPGREQQFFSLEKQTGTPAFKKFFGDSKVVDADGNPMVVYHGTIVRPDTGDVKGMGDILAFDRMFTTQFRRPSIDNVGSFFSTNPGEGGAQMYSGTGEGAAVYPVYLSIKNPYTTAFETMLRRARMMENGVDDGRKIGAKEVAALRKFLKESGKDGIHIKADPKSAEFKDQDVWIALEPEQIKSATGNRGTFDESANINKSLGDDLVKLTDQMAGDMAEDEKKRSPSLIRKLKTYNRQRKAGKMSDEMYVLMTDAAIQEDYENDLLNPAKPRQRGYLHIQERLSAAVRRGDITREAYDLANWFMQQNEALVDDLGISIKANKREGTGGFYNNLARIFTLIKEGSSDLTTVHEILHHLERMMPLKIQQAIRKAWLTQLTKAAKATKDPVQKLYFEAVLDANFGDNKHAMVNIPEGAGVAYSNARMALEDMARGNTSVKLAEMLLLQGAVPLSMYQFFNPSEFWAVNGSRIVEGRFEAVKGGTLSKLKNWLRELGQTIKSIFGLKSDASIIRALDSLAKSDGKFVTDEMLGVGDYQSIERRNYEGGEAPEPDMEIPEMSFMDDVIYKYGDKLIDTKRLIQSIQSTGRKINERFDAYMKEENYHGRLAKRTSDFLDDEMRPVLQEMQDKNVSLDELETFLLNRHAKEANAYIAKINPIGFPEAGSSVSDAAADKYMAELTPEKRKDLMALAAKVDKIIKETQRVLVENGLETEETIKEWNATYKHYVPLQRDNLDFVHTGRGVMGGFGTRGSASKRRVGSDKPVIDIFANIAMQRERALRRSEQARVGRALYGMAIKHPNPGFWLAINPDAIKDKDKLEAELISLGLTPEDARSIIQEPRQPMFDKKTGTVKYQVNPLLRDSPNVFPVRINGEDRFIFFNPNDPRALRMVQSMRNLDTETLGTAIGMAGMVTRWFASVNTQYNIVFGGVNFLRDLGAASLNLSTTEIAGKEKEVRANVLPALRAIYRDLRGKGATTESMAEMQDWFERYQLAGGQTGYQNQFAETKRKGNIVEQELKRLNRGNVKKSVDWLFDWLSDYNDAIENAVRLSAFKVAVESGLSEDKAASIAKNLTVNFNRKGAKSGLISALYAFFNAAVQGSARMIETLRGPMGKKIIYGGMFLGAMQAVVLAMAGFDDDEPPEFVKDKNLIIPIPFTDKKYLSVPMPLGFNMFPGFGRLAMETLLIETGMIRSRKGPGDKAMSAVSLVFDAFNPLGNAGNPLLMAMPTILDPFAAIYSNRDAFGRPIYREDKGTAPTPGYERSRENASVFSKKLAEAINWATSPAGTQHTKGWASPTADQIDYFIGQITGGVGRELMKVGEFAKSKAVTQEEVPAYKLPIVGRFYGEAESPAATRSRFYENVKEMAKHEHEIKGLRKDKVSPTEYIKANPEARLWQRANNVENQIVKLNKEKRALIEKDAPREAVKRKEDEILKKMTEFNNQVRRGQ